MAVGLTLDTGALMALERKRLSVTRKIRAAITAGDPVTVPSPVVVEWWRGGARQRRFLDLFRPKGLLVEPTSFALARVAGEAMAATGASAVDAVVMASAASRGDVVLTADLQDLERLRLFFPDVRLLRS